MPLIVSQVKPKTNAPMVGTWMREPGVTGPVNGVRVYITLEALWGLEPSQTPDVVASALGIFERRVGMIALAASRKFDYRSAGRA